MSNLEDVARKVGVSPMTVSRAINNKSDISKETRERVLRAVKELKYYPNSMGRGLISRKSNAIGILAPSQGVTFENPYYASIVTGIEKALIDQSMDMLMSTYKRKITEVDYLKPYYEKKVDGMIIVVPDMNNPQISEIGENNIPCVIIGERADHQNISYIDTDNENGGYQAVDYLIQKGHKKIAFLKGKDDNRNANDRLTGFLKALSDNHLTIPPYWVVSGDFSFSSGKSALQELIEHGELPTAVVCSNDLMAMGVLAEANAAGIKVPDQISIVGFDGIEMARYTHPSLTSFRQPLDEMGQKAVEVLMRKMKSDHKESEAHIFPFEVVIGGSVKDLN